MADVGWVWKAAKPCNGAILSGAVAIVLSNMFVVRLFFLGGVVEIFIFILQNGLSLAYLIAISLLGFVSLLVVITWNALLYQNITSIGAQERLDEVFD